MKKRLNIVIEDTCEECPFLHYVQYSDMSRNFYYRCTHPTIPESNSVVVVGESKTTLFGEEWPPISNNCPLEEFESS